VNYITIGRTLYAEALLAALQKNKDKEATQCALRRYRSKLKSLKEKCKEENN